MMVPATVESDLRGKALDVDADASAPRSGHGSQNDPLKRDNVAKRCIHWQAVNIAEHSHPTIAGLIYFTGSGRLS